MKRKKVKWLRRSAPMRHVDQFELVEELYHGKTSTLHEAQHRASGLHVAIKQYKKSHLTPLSKFQIEREVRIHITLRHPHIIELLAAFEDPEHVYLVQEFAPGGDLFEALKHQSSMMYGELEAVGRFMHPCLQALAYLHDRGIVHRDLKPENVLLGAGGALKLADFGLAIDTHQERPVTRAGTLDYMAPEVLVCPDKKQPEENKDKASLGYDEQVDAWAAGCLAAELITGAPPFESESRSTTYQLIMYREARLPSKLSQAARNFISAALIKDSRQRATIHQLLQHEWISNSLQEYQQTAAEAAVAAAAKAAAAAAAAAQEPAALLQPPAGTMPTRVVSGGLLGLVHAGSMRTSMVSSGSFSQLQQSLRRRPSATATVLAGADGTGVVPRGPHSFSMSGASAALAQQAVLASLADADQQAPAAVLSTAASGSVHLLAATDFEDMIALGPTPSNALSSLGLIMPAADAAAAAVGARSCSFSGAAASCGLQGCGTAASGGEAAAGRALSTLTGSNLDDFIATSATPGGRETTNLYAECKGIAGDWIPECWSATYAQISFGGDRTLYFTPYLSRRWGNALSPYWQARALALIAGQGFDAYEGFEGGWMQHLPKKLPPTTCPELGRFKEACDQCDSDSWLYAHRCHGAWQQIRPTIINDTHAAVQAWLQASKQQQQQPSFSPGDVVIQSRCSEDTLLSHPEFGPVGFSFFNGIDAAATKAIYIVAQPGKQLPACAAIRAAKVKHLEARYPKASVQVVGGKLEEDFLRLLFAPVLFKDAQSSFGLWAALGNKGQVFSVPMLPLYTNVTTPDLGGGWHWVAAPVLYPSVAAAAGIAKNDSELRREVTARVKQGILTT
ncbi:hypothetical protein OEZ86_011475 [Tetradesmus obliquus]|nr:hypothetical protein OEZ86_011475 [Tetradesmus obliquus]